MNKFLVVLFALLWAIAGFAETPPDTMWTRTYGGPTSDEWGYAVQETFDGNYIIAGWTDDGTASNHMYLIKANYDGDTLWTRTYNHGTLAFSVQQTADSGYIITGSIEVYLEGEHPYLVKTNSLGDTLWTHRYDMYNDDVGCSVQQTTDGGYIIGGYFHNYGAEVYPFLIKTNGLGDTLWTKTYESYIHAIRAYSVQQTSDGGYILAGHTSVEGTTADDFYLMKTDSQGNTQWTRTYGGSEDDEAYSVQQTRDGGFIVAGYTCSFGADECGDAYLVRTDSQGDTLWTGRYGGSECDGAFSVCQTLDDGFVLAGYTEIYEPEYVMPFYVVKTDSLGDTLWTQTYSWYEDCEARCVQETIDEGFIIAGTTHDYDNSNWDIFVVRTEGLGIHIYDPHLVIQIEAGNAALHWQLTGPTTYDIYGSDTPFTTGTLLDTVTGNTWTDENTATRPSPYFYYITPATVP